jgi:Family of unknown function (DUF5754)
MVKLLSVTPSKKAEKKYDAKFETAEGRTKTVSFGAKGMDDYTKTHDKEQRARYIERHGRGREDWSDPTSPGALSRYILWGESTSMMENLRRYRKRFNL